VFSAHLSTSLLIWVVSLLLSVGVGAVAAMAIGALVLSAGAALIALLVVVAAIANTFFWNYWTLAFMRLDSPATA
jgi:hypothetical protein